MNKVDLVAAWQKRMNDAFPKGVRLFEVPPDDVDTGEDGTWMPDPPFTAPRIEVTAMATPFSPIITLVMDLGNTGLNYTNTVDTFVIEQTEPCTLARVTFIDGTEFRMSGCLGGIQEEQS